MFGSKVVLSDAPSSLEYLRWFAFLQDLLHERTEKPVS